jgi:hypothetical protein
MERDVIMLRMGGNSNYFNDGLASCGMFSFF